MQSCSYTCVPWSVTVREEHTLKVFENRVLRGTNGAQVMVDRRRLQNEELNKLYALSNIIRVMKCRRTR